MKNKISFVALMLSLCQFYVLSQSFDFPKNENGEVEYSEVVESEFSKDVLFSNAKKWVVDNFGSYKDVVQYEDKEEGKLIVRGVSKVKYFSEFVIFGMIVKNSEHISFKMTIECKDNKYRYTMDDIIVHLRSVRGENLGDNTLFYRIDELDKAKTKKAELEEQLKAKESVDISSLKKKEKKKLEQEIQKIKGAIKQEDGTINSNLPFIESEVESLSWIIPSLKKTMSTDDSF